MRATLAEALKTALKAGDKRRTSTLRLIQAAIQDRDIAQRGAGKDAVTDDEILQILTKMVKQRQESAKAFEDGNRLELAAQERDESAIISEFLPRQMSEDEVREAAKAAIAEIGAEGLRDMGRAMAVLKERYPGQMDFGKASAIIKALLQ
ncbi:GatB/YqeY domain-containing protein [Hoeflea sp. 108]|uniref:GatB/YqeY domain-containing protein n=1 Tax=Hoeflea sp. 108 TaxID=1116369 RepID=UPI0003A96C18|nr:GatB/YqeY domain-containing protein [Hoeflea sp. 108]